eukprot:4530731-Alexandrium_andersonii.AAC.1
MAMTRMLLRAVGPWATTRRATTARASTPCPLANAQTTQLPTPLATPSPAQPTPPGSSDATETAS